MKLDIFIVLSVVAVAIIIFHTLSSSSRTAEIMLFTHSSCLVGNQTETIFNSLKKDFGDKIFVRKIVVKMAEKDPKDTPEIEQLRKKYNVAGVPVLVINGKEFTKEFTKQNIKEEICKNFIIKPEACA